ncbi:MAG: flagellar assembly protein FliW [Desulfosalsimonadaceae bacterium]
MKTLQTPFGEVRYDPEKVIRFPEGWIGFESLRDFVVMPGGESEISLYCFQSVEQPHLLFLLIDPACFFPDYQVQPDEGVLEKLGITHQDTYFILTTITFHQDSSVTLNLLAPLVHAPQTQRAVQIVLEGSSYKAKTPLPEKKTSGG